MLTKPQVTLLAVLLITATVAPQLQACSRVALAVMALKEGWGHGTTAAPDPVTLATPDARDMRVTALTRE